jgi:acyl-CoA synthetase (AMP-forming)/AMP-acid ligase II
MLGYLDNPGADAKAFTADRWLRTGDIGHFTEDGVVFISDRLKELIKVKGLQVAPAELEDTLRGLEGVLDVAVVGVEDERAGELPRAFIVREAWLTEAVVRAHMAERLAAHKQPAGGVVFLPAIPKSASGKILRRELVGL